MQTIHLDISAKNEVSYIYAKQGDVGRKFMVVLSNNGTDYSIPDGAVAAVWYSGTSGEGNYTSVGENSAVVIEDNVLTVEMIAQMLVNKGGGTMCLVLHGADGSQIGTWDMEYLSEPVPGADSEQAQAYYTAFSENARISQEAALRAEEAAAKLDVLTMYPVGSIYMSVSNTSPEVMFGGTWEQIKDVFLLASGDSYGAGTTGGAAVTVHSHELPVGISGGYIYADSQYGAHSAAATSGTAYAVAASNITTTATTRSTASSSYLDNLPPYLAVYMWKRVA